MIAHADRRAPGGPRADARDLPPRPAARGVPHRDRPRRRRQRATARSTPRAPPTASTGITERIDANGFGASAGVRRARAGPRSPTSRASTRRTPPRCAWRTSTTAPGTSRRSRTRPSGRRRARPTPRASGSRSTATWRSRSPTSIPAATRCGSSARTPARSASAPCPPRRRAPRSRSAPTARSASSAPGLAGEDARLWVATGRLGGATQHLPGDGPVGQLGRDRGLRERRPDRGLPRPPRRLRRGARQAPLPQLADRPRVALQREQPVQRAPSAPRARARTASASRWSRTARCSCSPRALSSPRPVRGARRA